MKELLKRLFYRVAYQRLMRFAHRHNWHHTTTLQLENGDVQHWCQWCGLRETLHRGHFLGVKLLTDSNCPRNSVMLVNLKDPAWFQ